MDVPTNHVTIASQHGQCQVTSFTSGHRIAVADQALQAASAPSNLHKSSWCRVASSWVLAVFFAFISVYILTYLM